MGVNFAVAASSPVAGGGGTSAGLPPHRRPHSLASGPATPPLPSSSRETAPTPPELLHGLSGHDRASDLSSATTHTSNTASSAAQAPGSVPSTELDAPRQLLSALGALGLDWHLLDHEIDLITVHLIAWLLTSRVRTQGTNRAAGTSTTAARSSSHMRGSGYSAADMEEPQQREHADGLHAAADADAVLGDHGEDSVGAQELYVSAALRLAALQLGREGLQRVALALAYLASGGESQEERKLRKISSSSTNLNVTRAASSPQEMHHFQHGVGFAVAASAAGATGGGGSGGPGGPSVGTALGSGSTLHSHASSASTLASRKFSTALLGNAAPAASPSKQPQQQSNVPVPGPSSVRSPMRGGAPYRTSASLDLVTLCTPLHRGLAVPGGGGGGHMPTHPALKPATAYSYDDAASLFSQGPPAGGAYGAAQAHYTHQHPQHPLPPHRTSRAASSVGGSSAASYLLHPRRVVEAMSSGGSSLAYTYAEQSYNMGLLRSMNARSTIMSTMRTFGGHGEMARSCSSITTLASLSPAAAAAAAAGTVRTPRNELFTGGGSSLQSGVRSPLTASLYTTTHWNIPPAPLTNLGGAYGGLNSPHNSIAHSLYSLASPPGAVEARRRTDLYSRRSPGLLSPSHTGRQTTGAAAAGRAGRGRGSYEDLGGAMTTALLGGVPCHLPAAMGGSVMAGPEAYSGALGGQTHPMLHSTAACRDTSLQLLPPEAVLIALCTLFAHFHLSSDDVSNLVTLLVVAVLEVQIEAQLRQAAADGPPSPGPSGPHPPSLSTPASVGHIRSLVTDCVRVALLPLYAQTRRTLSAAAGVPLADAAPTAAGGGGGIEWSAPSAFTSPLLPPPRAWRAPTAQGGSSGSGDPGNELSPLPTSPPNPAAMVHAQATALPAVSSTLPVRSLKTRPGFAGLVGASSTAPPQPPPLPPTGLLLQTVSATSALMDADDPQNASVNSNSATDVLGRMQAVHDFFALRVPIESAPPLRGAAAAAATRSVMAKRLSAVGHRSSSTRTSQVAPGVPPSQPSRPPATPASSTGVGCAVPLGSDSLMAPASTNSLSHSTTTDTNLATSATASPALTATAGGSATSTRGPATVGSGPTAAAGLTAAFAPPTQAEVRCATHFLMDLDSAFVLHYAEAVGDAEDALAAAAPEVTSFAGRRGQSARSSASSSRRGSFSSASGTASTAPGSASGSAAAPAHVQRRRRSDADPDVFVQFATGSSVWPLRTRLLVRRHDYAYVYDAIASTMALVREESLYAADAELDSASTQSPHVPHPHTPVAVIDLNRATAERVVNDMQIISGPGDVEVVSLMPSRLSRAAAGAGGGYGVAAAASPFARRRRAGLGSPSQPGTPLTRTAAADLLSSCWADAMQHDIEVYRMKGNTGTMYLLSMPAEEESPTCAAGGGTASSIRARSRGGAASSAAATASSGGGAGAVITATSISGGSTAAAASADASQASVVHSFERNRLVRPVVLSLSSQATPHSPEGASDAHRRGGAGRATSAGALIRCGFDDGSREVLALEVGTEPTRIAAYPLRLLYHGVLHHFFFANPSTRDQWYQQLLQLSCMTQSTAYLERVASAPQDVERYLRNRISFPTGPGAFECLDMLGAGTFGRVLLVQHKLSKRLFAMKVIRKSGFHGVRNIIEARREKKILDTLDCPYIMKIHSSFQTDSRVYMLFDYLPGAELLLHTQSAHGHHFDETTSRFYIAELAVAVEYLRVRGIVHRDIKGDNLVLDSDGHVVLTDFGFAKNVLAEATEPGGTPQVIRQHTSCGTLAYIAPEVLYNSRRRNGYGLAVDWWSLGVVLFTFLTGYFPFLKPTGPETSHAIVHSALQFPPRPALSEEARSLLQQLLHKDPAQRITSLSELRHHPFFDGFDWAACRERRLPPPVVLHKDSYRSPRTTADARQVLQDRVRRSLAWSSAVSAGTAAAGAAVPYVPPTHSRRAASDSLTLKFQAPLDEERAELRLVEEAYGPESMPKPLSGSNDVFGPLFEMQERCGSDRDESDVDELGLNDYCTGSAPATYEAMRQLKEQGLAASELQRCPSNISLNSASQNYAAATLLGAAATAGGTGGVGIVYDDDVQRRAAAAAAATALSSMLNALHVPPVSDFTEALYGNVALARYGGGAAAR